MLRTLGLLATALYGLTHWWPIALIIVGAAILARSVRPGPHITVAILFILGGCISFAATRGFISGRIWIFAAAAGLIAAGAILAWANIATSPKSAESNAPLIFVLFRAADFTTKRAKLDRVSIFLICGRLELHLEEAVEYARKYARRRNTIIVEITSLIGTVHIFVPGDADFHKHDAFVKRLRQPFNASMLDQERCDEADVVASALSLFGDIKFTRTGPPNPVP